ncbi:MAG: hypothetical protein R2712_30850 [Vicinamibacterales bacterium]
MEEVRRRQTADAGTDDDEIAFLACVHGRSGGRPERAVTQPVQHLEGSGVRAAEACERRRIACGILREER